MHCKPWYDFKSCTRKSKEPTDNLQTLPVKQKNFDLRYEFKTITKKLTSQQQPKKVKTSEFCPNPQQQKVDELKN